MRPNLMLRIVLCAFSLTAGAQLKNLKPGWNLFSPQQDIQLGQEAAAVPKHSLMAQLAQVDIGVAGKSPLLSLSRTDESHADYNGAQLMADAGYNTLEMANFFEKLEKQGGPRGRLSQFLSDHPNP